MTDPRVVTVGEIELRARQLLSELLWVIDRAEALLDDEEMP